MDRRKLLSSLGLGAIAVFAAPVVLSISSARASTGGSGGGSSGGSEGSGSSSGGSDAGGPSASSSGGTPSASSSGGTPSAGTSSVADVDDLVDDVTPNAAGGSCIVGMNCQ